ncbi:MAG: peptidase S41, partial [Candidatus Dormibacteria bacterium]
MTGGGYFRQPTVAGDTVVFVSEDDLWTVPTSGGSASRLTAGLAAASNPRLSPDGSTLAFVSHEEHHPEAWCMPATGGPAKRLTWLGRNTSVAGWTPDGRVLAVSNAQQPLARRTVAVAVDPATGELDWLGLGPCNTLSWA